MRRTMNVAMVALPALLLALSAGLAQGQTDSTEGTDFVLMFMQNIVEYTQPRPVELFFTNVGSQTAYVTVTLPGCPMNPAVVGPDTCLFHYFANVSAGGSVRLRLCSGIRHSYADGSVANKAVTVSSTAPIRVFAYNSDTFSADSFVVLRSDVLDRTHLIQSYSPANIATQFGIVAPVDTNVFVSVSANRRDNVVIDYNGVRYTKGERFRARLQQYSTLLFYSVTDLSGIVVSADKPIAVFSGNVRAYVDGLRTSRDHLVEQVIPASQLGYDYVYQPTPRSNSNDIVRFTARVANTVVSLYTAAGSLAPFSLSDVGQVQELALTTVTHITSSQPLSVAVIVRSQEGADAGSGDFNDPSLYFLPAVNSFPPVNTIAPSYVYSVTNGFFNRSYLLIATRNTFVNGFRIDGVPTSGFYCNSTLPLPYCTAVISINPAVAHTITHSDSAARALIVQYSASDRESAATILGVSLSGACRESTQKIGDKIDNDCDGAVDEELCNGYDDDHDLLEDEDCGTGVVTSSGSEYAVVFMSNDISDNLNVITQLELYVAPVNDNVTVTVTSPYNGYSVVKAAPLNAATQIPIDSDFLLGVESDFGQSRVTNKGLYVSADGPIVLYGINKRTYSTDGFISFPFGSAGKTYYAVTSYPINTNDDRCQVAIVSHEDNANDIAVTLRPGVVLSINAQTYTGPTTFVLQTMNKMDAWELQSINDLTGTKIESASGKRFSVYSGNIRHRNTLLQTSRDHIVEQMPPKSTLGNTFSSISSPRTVAVGDIWKIVASAPNTVVNYWYTNLNTNTPFQGTINLAAETDYSVIDPNCSAVIHIESNNPILLTQIVKSSTNPAVEMTDPALILLPPLEQWGNNYLFVTPKSGQLNGSIQLPYINYIFLVIESSLKGGLSIINPDRTTTSLGSLSGWTNVPHSSHQALIYRVIDGQNKIVHSDPAATYMGIMFGVQDRESYGQAVGLRLQTICAKDIAGMIPGDQKDNDCDGKIDEELLDKLDNDGDGLIDEDCYALPNLNVAYFVLYEQNDVEYPRYYPLELYVGNDNHFDLYCNVKSNAYVGPSYDVTFKLSPMDVKTVAFAPTLRVVGTRKSSKTFTVLCNAKATVFGLNKETWSNDGFIVYPMSALGKSYYTVSYSPQELMSQFAIIAAEGGITNVNIKVASNITYNATQYLAGDTLSITLNKFEAFQAQSVGDLTASYITADKRIAVFSGDIRTHVVLSKSRDHLVSQMPPTNSYGTDFHLVPNPARTVGDVYRIISSAAGNNISICCNSSTNAIVSFTLDQGQWREQQLSSNSFCHLTATKPTLVARIMKSQDGPLSNELSDPCLTLIAPTSQYGNSATLLTPLYTGGKKASNIVSFDYVNYLTLVVPNGSQNGLRVNGNPVSNVNRFGEPVVWTNIECSGYSAGTIQLDSSVRRFQVFHQSPSVKFTGYLTGGADRESYCVTVAHDLPDLP